MSMGHRCTYVVFGLLVAGSIGAFALGLYLFPSETASVYVGIAALASLAAPALNIVWLRCGTERLSNVVFGLYGAVWAIVLVVTSYLLVRDEYYGLRLWQTFLTHLTLLLLLLLIGVGGVAAKFSATALRHRVLAFSTFSVALVIHAGSWGTTVLSGCDPAEPIYCPAYSELHMAGGVLGIAASALALVASALCIKPSFSWARLAAAISSALSLLAGLLLAVYHFQRHFYSAASVAILLIVEAIGLGVLAFVTPTGATAVSFEVQSDGEAAIDDGDAF